MIAKWSWLSDGSGCFKSDPWWGDCESAQDGAGQPWQPIIGDLWLGGSSLALGIHWSWSVLGAVHTWVDPRDILDILQLQCQSSMPLTPILTLYDSVHSCSNTKTLSIGSSLWLDHEALTWDIVRPGDESWQVERILLNQKIWKAAGSWRDYLVHISPRPWGKPATIRSNHQTFGG